MSTKKSGSFFGVAVLLGAIIGYLVSLFVPDKTRRQHKKALTSQAEQLKDLLTDPEEREKIKAIFGKHTTKAQSTYQEAKDHLISNLTDLKGTIADIDKAKYQKAVTKAVSQIKKDKKLPTKQLTKLKKYLEQDFSRLKPAAKKQA